MAATDPFSLGIAGAAALTALLAGWFQVRRAPALDGERWLKTTLATLLRGRIEAQGGDGDAWAATVRARVPYHPAGREPDRKVLHPHAVPDGPLLEGEQALLESLRGAPDVAARWSLLYDVEAEYHPLLDDPIELGPDYAPASLLGPGTTWDDLARWAAEPGFGERLAARHPLVWVCVRPPEDGAESRILDALVDLWPHTVALAPGDDPEALVGPLLTPDARLVFAAEGDAIADTLSLLAENDGLRDHVVAVLAIGAPILGREGGPPEVSPSGREDWMGHHFGQKRLDTEEIRLTPYMALQWLDRTVATPGTARQPLGWARFPKPATQGVDVETIESVDLGVLPRPGGPDDDLVARALLYVVTGWAAARS